MIDLLITTQDIRSALQVLVDHPQEVVRLSLGINRRRGGIQLLATHADRRSPGEKAESSLYLWATDRPDALYPHDVALALSDKRQKIAAALAIGTGALQDRAHAVVRLDDAPVRSFDAIHLIGPQMHTLEFSAGLRPLLPSQWLAAEGLYSRVIGTMGLQQFARLQRSRIAVIGAGGSGSQMALTLARLMGRDSHLAIIDPDRLAECNLSAWAAPMARPDKPIEGRDKAELLAEIIRTLPDPPQVEAVTASILDWPALAALKRCDICCCCVDNPTARYTAAFLAGLYHRPLLDVATGIFLGGSQAEHRMQLTQEREGHALERVLFAGHRLPRPLLEAGRRTLGADIRLTIPGATDQAGNCLLCLGGVGDLDPVWHDLAAPPTDRARDTTHHPFWEGRAGTQFLLNGDAVNQGIRALLALLSGEIEGSTHWQMEIASNSAPAWQLTPPRPQPDCPICACAGLGDAGLDRIEHRK